MSAIERHKKKTSFLARMLLGANVLVITILGFGFLAAWVAPDKYWLFAFAGIVFPYAALINLIFIFIWLAAGRKYFILSLLAMIICWNRQSSYIQFNRSSHNAADTVGIKVLTYNVRIFDLYNWKSKKISKTASRIFDLLKNQDPDILCLQEYHAGRKGTIDIADSVMHYTGLKYKHIAYARLKNKTKPYGIATFSRWPIVSSGIIQFENNSVNFCIYSDVVVRQDTIRFFNIHLESIQLSNEDYLYVEEITKQPESQEIFSKNLNNIFRKLKKAFIARASQSRTIAGHIKDSPYPVVVCGDFNDTPSSYAYAQVSTSLIDAFKQSGNGIGQTYAGKMPSFRIDYILHNPGFKSVDYARIKEQLSDHYPVKATILTSPTK